MQPDRIPIGHKNTCTKNASSVLRHRREANDASANDVVRSVGVSAGGPLLLGTALQCLCEESPLRASSLVWLLRPVWNGEAMIVVDVDLWRPRVSIFTWRAEPRGRGFLFAWGEQNVEVEEKNRMGLSFIVFCCRRIQLGPPSLSTQRDIRKMENRKWWPVTAHNRDAIFISGARLDTHFFTSNHMQVGFFCKTYT